MPRATASCPAQRSTTSGLAALVRLINDELLARGTRLAGLSPALAGPAWPAGWGRGPLAVHSAIETPSPTPGRTSRLPGRAGRVLHAAPKSSGSTLPDGGNGPDSDVAGHIVGDIDSEHVEIWQLVARRTGR